MTLATGHPSRDRLSGLGLFRLGRLIGPPTLLAAAVLAVFGTVAMAPATLSNGSVGAVIAILLFLTASAAALVAWLGGRRLRGRGLTYWDVAGALTFIGICVAATVEPNEMVALIEATDRKP